MTEINLVVQGCYGAEVTVFTQQKLNWDGCVPEGNQDEIVSVGNCFMSERLHYVSSNPFVLYSVVCRQLMPSTT